MKGFNDSLSATFEFQLHFFVKHLNLLLSWAACLVLLALCFRLGWLSYLWALPVSMASLIYFRELYRRERRAWTARVTVDSGDSAADERRAPMTMAGARDALVGIYGRAFVTRRQPVSASLDPSLFASAAAPPNQL